MSRISPIDRKHAPENVARTFDAIQRKLGTVPNMMLTMAQSPNVLEGYLSLSGALSRGLLTATLQEQIAIAIAEANGCSYCLSAHTVLGRRAGLPEEQLAASREGRGADARTTAALQFALAVLQTRGDVGDQKLARVRAADFSDAEIAEIIAHVALNVFTNYFNRVADTGIDFPLVAAGQPV